MLDSIIEALRAGAAKGTFPAHLATMPLVGETRVGDLGLDSLGKMELLLEAQALADRYIPDSSFNDEATLSEVAVLLDSSITA